jgi:Na+/proline symporter
VTSSPTDPVRARRQRISSLVLIANRIGYLLYALAIALFVMAFAFGFNGVLVTLVTISLVLGSILLAPAIVLGYAVKAAEREDRERGL